MLEYCYYFIAIILFQMDVTVQLVGERAMAAGRTVFQRSADLGQPASMWRKVHLKAK